MSYTTRNMMAQMKTISLTTAKRNFSKLIEDVENGETFVITRYGRPIARLTRHELNKSVDQDWLAAYEQMAAKLDKGASLGGLRVTREDLYDR